MSLVLRMIPSAGWDHSSGSCAAPAGAHPVRSRDGYSGPDRDAVDREHIASIQMLRGLAALAIAIHHGIFDAEKLAAETGAIFVFPRLFPWRAGVDLFFVISGFVMIYASRGLFGKSDAPRRFLWRRLSRVVPLYWATTTLVVTASLMSPGAVSGGVPTPASVLASLAFVPLARPDGAPQPVYSLGWTLNYEMFFYLLFAMFLPLNRRAALIALSFTLAGVAGLGLLLHPSPAVLRFWSAPIILLFGAGMGIATLRIKGLRLPLWLRLAMVLAALALLTLDPLGLMRDPLRVAQALDASCVLGWGGPAALLVSAAGLGESGARRGSAMLSPPLVAIGEASYALYLIHPFVFRAWHVVLQHSRPAAVLHPSAYLALIVLSATLVSLGVHRFVERPVTAYLRPKRSERLIPTPILPE
jgi:exopolysaccharide production protein ExoZ